jgi:acetyl-CoA decarbonylase/synthase complex subunit gamma
MKYSILNDPGKRISLVKKPQQPSCCSECLPDIAESAERKADAPFINGYIKTASGYIPRVSTKLSSQDRWEHIKARTGPFRMKFTVKPGLYATGNPDENSDVMVTANYRMSFNKLRSALDGRDAWILVLDTAGINVWCAAGKGTFGTAELVRRISMTGIADIVKHRKIIVPQLGAPGVNYAEVRRKSGFSVLFGPVRVEEIGRYIQDGYKADPDMRRMRFGIKDRVILTPIELYMILPKFPYFVLFTFIVFGLNPQGIMFKDAWFNGYPFLAYGILSIITGAFITPVLLPFVPFRAFSVKGWLAGALVFFPIVYFSYIPEARNVSRSVAERILFPLISSYLALQFTGATTFTNLSGVKKEIRYSLPVYITGTVISFICLILYKVSEWGII